MEITERVETSRSADDAWALVGDFSRLAEWDPGVARVERIDDGPVRVGSEYRVWVRMGPWTSPLQYRVESLSERQIVLRGRSAWFEAVDDVSVGAKGSGAVVLWRAELSPAGPLRFTEPLWRPGLRRVAQSAMDGLRRALE